MTYLRLSITDHCDMRCTYCAPSRAMVRHCNDVLSLDEIRILVRAFAANGVTKVRLTGGEPLLRSDITAIVRTVAETPGITTVAMTTNGRNFAPMAAELKSSGLQRVNISLDSLDRKTFEQVSGCDALDEVLRSIGTALQSGFEKVKTNTVVMRGVNDSEVPRIAALTMEEPLEVRFIELMPLGHSSREWRSLFVPADEIRQAIGPMEPLPRDDYSSADLYRIPGAMATVGIISPVSERFCKRCSRIRVTCSGILRPCLRSSVGIDVRPVLHSSDPEAEITALLPDLQEIKRESIPMDDPVQTQAMSAIGG